MSRAPDVGLAGGVLPNGLRFSCVARPSAHRAVVSLFLRVGSRFENVENNGVSHFLEHMLYRGSPSHPTAHDQALAFERIGGTLYAATQADHGLMSLALPPESLEAAVPKFAEVALQPLFSEIEIERGIVREEILEDLDEDGRQVDADNIARSTMYGKHSLGFTITGTSEQLERFDRDLLRSHHDRHYTASNAVLCFAGAIDVDRCAELARKSFAGMPPGERIGALPPPMSQQKPRLRFVRNLSSQTALRIAFRAVGDHDPREPAVEMLLRVLDDGMSTRLYERICDAKGLCYDVGALFESYEDDGVFDVAAEVQHARTPEVAHEILRILSELADHGPTAEELDKAKTRHGWQMRAMLDDQEALAGFHGLAALAEIARTPGERHRQLCDVSREEVRDVAAAIFRRQRLSAIAVGALTPALEAALEKEVRAFGSG